MRISRLGTNERGQGCRREIGMAPAETRVPRVVVARAESEWKARRAGFSFGVDPGDHEFSFVIMQQFECT